MASEVVNIPVRSIPDCFQSNRVDDLRLFLILKAKEGRFLPQQHNYCQKKLNRLCRIGWLTKHGDQYYQKKWVDVFPAAGVYTHGKIKIEDLEDPKRFKAVLFVIGNDYSMMPQTPKGIKSRERSVEKTQVKESKHNGGISLTLNMKFFGFKKTWCSNMRKLCSKMGLASWERRMIEVPVTRIGNIDFRIAEQLMEGPGRYKIGRNNSVQEEITSKYTPIMESSLHIPYEYRSIVKNHYS